MVTRIILKTEKPIEDFAKERNDLLKKSDSDWIFFIDSDEEITPELENEINNCDFKYDGYYIKRRDFFFGKLLKYGETGNIKLVRLGKKGRGLWKRKVHEYWDIKNVGELKNPLLHYPHLSIFNFIKKINYYSEIDAREFNKFSYFDVLFKPVGKFIFNYFVKLGFFDGFAGFVHAYMMSFQSLVVRVKQYEKNSSQSSHN